MTTLCGPHQRLVPTDLPMQHDFLSNFIDFNYWIAPTELRIQVVKTDRHLHRHYHRDKRVVHLCLLGVGKAKNMPSQFTEDSFFKRGRLWKILQRSNDCRICSRHLEGEAVSGGVKQRPTKKFETRNPKCETNPNDQKAENSKTDGWASSPSTGEDRGEGA